MSDETIPICPRCNDKSCIWDLNLDDWSICQSCREIGLRKLSDIMGNDISGSHAYMRKVGIPERYIDAALTDFDNGSKIAAIQEGKGVLVEGKIGAGKTHLLCALAKYKASIGHTTRFVPCVEIVSNMRELGFAESERYQNELIKVDCLFLDDFGTQGNSEFVYAAFFRILNERYNQKKETSISLNGKLNLVCDDRMTRRITEMMVKITL